MIPLTKASYYAVRGSMGTDVAFGGVVVNEDTQAHARDGGLVEDLYVVGDFSSGRFVNMGGVRKQIINDLVWAFAKGFIAADRVSEYLTK